MIVKRNILLLFNQYHNEKILIRVVSNLKKQQIGVYIFVYIFKEEIYNFHY